MLKKNKKKDELKTFRPFANNSCFYEMTNIKNP
jgi:hypothetical protein